MIPNNALPAVVRYLLPQAINSQFRLRDIITSDIEAAKIKVKIRFATYDPDEDIEAICGVVTALVNVALNLIGQGAGDKVVISEIRDMMSESFGEMLDNLDVDSLSKNLYLAALSQYRLSQQFG